jgi:hypothetical protein
MEAPPSLCHPEEAEGSGPPKVMKNMRISLSDWTGSLKGGLQSLRENSALSPVGTFESSPGRSPGLGVRYRAGP